MTMTSESYETRKKYKRRAQADPENRIQPGDGDRRHGTLHGYSYHLCSCDLCRLAHNEYMKKIRAKAKARGIPPGDPRHGTPSGFRYFQCECDICLNGRRAYARERSRKERAQQLRKKQASN